MHGTMHIVLPLACDLPEHHAALAHHTENLMSLSAEGARPSIWDLTAELPALDVLNGSQTADVCVIGAGMAGLSAAYELVLAGRSVIVLDDGRIGGGETGRTTAHVASSFDDYYHEVERMHGEEASRRLGESFRVAVDRIESIVRAESIDCDFRRVDGWWFVPADGPDRGDAGGSSDDDVEALRKEVDAARRAGFHDVELTSTWPLDGVWKGRPPAAIMRFPRQGQFHALRYLDGLARAITTRGARIYSGAHVVKVEDGTDDARCRVHTESGAVVSAQDVIVATNTPFNDRVTMHTKQAPYRTYVIAARVAREAIPTALYWDTLDPYHYVRLLSDAGEAATPNDVLIVGGQDHKTGQEADENVHFDALEHWTRERFPIEDVVARWSGQVLEPVDYVAFIGRNPGERHVYIATGDSGNGITHGAIAGMLLRDLVTGAENPWTELFDPSRISLRATSTWISENANVARQYADLVTPGEVSSVEHVPPGQGRVLRDGAKKVAVYRDDSGALTARSAVCTHLGCIVDWNSAERTWDCPCHGSRFATDGTVINGPASRALAAAEVPRAESTERTGEAVENPANRPL